MRTRHDFNKKYKKYLEKNMEGMVLDIPSVLEYVSYLFDDLTKISGFKYDKICTERGMAKVYTNLEEIMPLAGRIISQELEEKINIMLKIEYEVERRLILQNNLKKV